MRKEDITEYFTLEEKLDSETMRSVLIHSSEQFSVDNITIALRGNFIYSKTDDNNTYIKYEEERSAQDVFLSMKNKLKEL